MYVERTSLAEQLIRRKTAPSGKVMGGLMVRDEADSPASQDQEGTRRARYERPVLRRLGSVNKLTLHSVNGSVTDTVRTKPRG
jgi:hypothetical protein